MKHFSLSAIVVIFSLLSCVDESMPPPLFASFDLQVVDSTGAAVPIFDAEITSADLKKKFAFEVESAHPRLYTNVYKETTWSLVKIMCVSWGTGITRKKMDVDDPPFTGDYIVRARSSEVFGDSLTHTFVTTWSVDWGDCTLQKVTLDGKELKILNPGSLVLLER